MSSSAAGKNDQNIDLNYVKTKRAQDRMFPKPTLKYIGSRVAW